MHLLFGGNWHDAFVPSVSLLEIVVRGTIIYLGLFTLLRIVLKRESGELSITDMLVIVLIADAAQNGMAGEYTSITEGLALVATIIFWSYALEWLAFHVAPFRRIARPGPLPLVRHGRLVPRNMRRELITKDELMSKLRKQGIEDLADVEAAYMEGDGSVSVISRDEKTKS